MIHHTTGDLFETKVPALAHGCNTTGVMGSGIALGFRQRYPEMYNEYRQGCLQKKWTPGQVFVWEADDGRTILNLFTQDQPGAHARYEWVYASFLRAASYLCLLGEPIQNLAIPRIGAGIGGLEWTGVEEQIFKATENSDLDVIVYSLEK